MQMDNNQRSEPATDMNRFRKALRVMWQTMQRDYVNADSNLFRDHEGVLRFRKTEFPDMGDKMFECRRQT